MSNNMDVELEEITNKTKKQKITIMILGVITVLVAVIGASFAYYSSVINSTNGNQSITVGTTTIEGVTYKASDTIALLNALPGDSASTDFTITNPNSSAKTRYTLKFVADVNEFSNENGDGQLLITVTNGKMSSPVVLDFTDGKNVKDGIIVSNVELEPTKSDVYNLQVEFVDTNTSQDANQSKTFVGHIEITQSIVVE